MLVSERASRMSASRQRAPFSLYSPSPFRSIRREIEISENSLAALPSVLSITTSTSAKRRGDWPLPPAKITSRICWPRIADGLCSPRAQRTASVMFDLPEPFGPTITLTPGEKVSRVRSGNDLNPFRLIAFRYTSVQGSQGLEASRVARTASHNGFLAALGAPTHLPLQVLKRAARGLLLGFLLASSRASADLIPGHRRPNLEAAVVGRPGLARYLVEHRLPPAGEPLLELGLEIEALEGRLLDLLVEGGDDGRRSAPETVLEVAGADHRLAHRRQRPLGGEQGLDRQAIALRRGVLGEHLRQSQIARHGRTGAAADPLVEDLGELADVRLGVLREEQGRDREAEDAVAEEREPTVGGGSLIDP